ncbi:hypothetical protein AAHA92_09407 [Salvia divinorum]|uniref:Uncharacterized protein n=1 Tax=Salvia divinorum TaxID=28513 RepID=A0ABD1HR89_SALDI
MNFFNYDPQEEMDEFMRSQNWVVSATQVAPSPATGSTTGGGEQSEQSPVSTGDYDISEMEATNCRKDKGRRRLMALGLGSIALRRQWPHHWQIPEVSSVLGMGL